jgi:hypothetical protein
MENFDYFGVRHYISQHFSSQPEGLEISLLVHIPDIDQEGISAIVKLNHLNESSLPKISLEIHS